MKHIIKNLLREGLEKYDGYEFMEDYYDYNNNQDYIRCTMEKDGQVLAHADYVQYEGKIYISIIESHVKGKGYGTILMKHIAKLYGYENMPASSLTPDGVKMRQRLDKEFNYTPPEEVNNHIPVSTIEQIKNPVIKAFLLDLINLGYTKVWKKWLTVPEFEATNQKLMKDYDIDFNEISDIGEWVMGSKTNTNDPQDEVPEWITDYLSNFL